MHKFTHIDQFYQVARYVHAANGGFIGAANLVRSPVSFKGTVKLHGSNAGVVCTHKGLVAQSRNRQLTVDDDNLGFAKFITGADQVDAIRVIESGIRFDFNLRVDEKLVLYGEWIGPGIQNGVAVNGLPEKQWVVFAAKVVDGEQSRYIDALSHFLDEFAAANIHSVCDVKPWYIDINFNDNYGMSNALELMGKWTQTVEDQCPWARRFGIEGMGEGIVWMPMGDHWGDSDLFFKTKGEKHKVVERAKRNKPTIDPEVVSSVAAFVKFAVTDNRLEQGLDYLREMGKPVDMKSTGDFLKWVGGDVKRECAPELEDNELEWKQVSKAVNRRALEFFKERAQAF